MMRSVVVPLSLLSCVCVYVRERERVKEREGRRKGERESEREGGKQIIFPFPISETHYVEKFASKKSSFFHRTTRQKVAQIQTEACVLWNFYSL